HGRSYHQAFPLATIYLPKHGTRRRDDATLELAGPPHDEIQTHRMDFGRESAFNLTISRPSGSCPGSITSRIP
ncbi:MAG TPA: hypothetical protein VFK65_07420, partial [Candidatus Binatia bacterium]|nr:hypothetical protein [Candidatus Binatia bacterium]